MRAANAGNKRSTRKVGRLTAGDATCMPHAVVAVMVIVLAGAEAAHAVRSQCHRKRGLNGSD